MNLVSQDQGRGGGSEELRKGSRRAILRSSFSAILPVIYPDYVWMQSHFGPSDCQNNPVTAQKRENRNGKKQRDKPFDFFE